MARRGEARRGAEVDERRGERSALLLAFACSPQGQQEEEEEEG